MSRGEIKRVLRGATKLRIRAERQMALASLPEPVRQAHIEAGRVDLLGRLEEGDAIRRFSKVPSIFAFAEQLDSRYRRPDWAGRQYGAQ